MASVKIQMSDSEYRLVIDGDEEGDFLPYGDAYVVEFEGGEVYWCVADSAEDEAAVYHGKLVTDVEYEDVEVAAEEDEVEVEQES